MSDVGNPHRGATGIELIDKEKNFCKENVRWVTKQQRKRIKSEKNKVGHKKLGFPHPVTITMEKEKFVSLCNMCLEYPKNHSVSSLVRNAIDYCYFDVKEVTHLLLGGDRYQ